MRAAAGKQARVALLVATLWIALCGLFYCHSAAVWSFRRSTPSLYTQAEHPGGWQHGCNKKMLHAMIPCRCEDDQQAERQRRLGQWCSRHPRNATKRVRLSQLIQMTYVDDARKLIYCDVPKVATTNWKRVFLYLSGKWNVSRPEEIAAKDVHTSPILEGSLPKLSKFSADEIISRLETYTKFFFVRHPMERLVSAYRNKFQNQNNSYFPQRYGRQIIKLYRPNATTHSLEHGTDVQFSEFVDYLVDTEVRGYEKNPHWAPITSLCHPCDIRYDFVGQLETLSSDADAILSRLGVVDVVHFPARADTYGLYAPSAELLASTFSEVPHSKLRRLLALYGGDMEAFGYNCNCSRLRHSKSFAGCDG